MNTPIAVVMSRPNVRLGGHTQTQEISIKSFLNFIFKERANRILFTIAVIGITIQFIIFKRLYPYADFFSDSYSYLFAAYANLDINIWPIGYSKFLRFFHSITHSDTALVGFQFFFLELSSIYFFFTTLYFFNLSRISRIILFIFLFFNPLFSYVCNYVNSDPLFIASSVCWFTQLIWIIHRPRTEQIFIQALLLFACFTIRNNAYIYPVLTVVAFALSKYRLWLKVSGILLGLVFIIPFIIHTRNAAYKLTGVKQFSLFTGWQLANNALYAYEYMDTTKTLSPKVQELDRISWNFYKGADSLFHKKVFRYVGNYFIREPYAPLKWYLTKHYAITDQYSQVAAWGKSSVIFSEYGSYLIKNNLRAYAWEFMLPNSRNYFLPPLEKLAIYNLGLDEVDEIAKVWFHYKTNKVTAVSNKVQDSVLFIFPTLFLVVNFYFFSNLFLFWVTEKYKSTTFLFNSYLILASGFLLLNFLFSVFATIIVFRYEVFPLIICLASALLIAEPAKQIREAERIKENNPLHH